MSLARPTPAVRGASEGGSKPAFAEWVRDNGLSLVLFGLFLIFLCGQSVVGWLEHNATARDHGERVIGYLPYLLTGHFWEAVFENWESEFLQMAAYVVLTSCLIQKGSAESKKPREGETPQDEDPRLHEGDSRAPAPVRRGGAALWWYQRSLSLSLALFFLLSFVGHVVAGSKEFSQDQLAHGEPAVSPLQYLGTSRLWFESLQNWQSEFLAVFALVVLSIWLRERGSPESKQVASPHEETGAS